MSLETRLVNMSVEIERYVQDVVVFLRMHRAVTAGVSPQATRDLELLLKCLAALHGLAYVTPSLVALAVPKVYKHRLILTAPEDERSLQYGSDLRAIKAYLKGVSPSTVIEDVLDAVEVPV